MDRYSGRIDSDTSWSGDILLEGDIYVEPGVTLTIKPGTRIFFSGGEIKTEIQRLRRVEGATYDIFSPERIEIICAGDIIARGTEENPITLSAPPANPERGGGFNFVGNRSTSALEFVHIKGGYIGVRVYDSRAPIMENLTVTGNTAGGIGFWDTSSAVIKDSYVYGNKYGIGAADGTRVDISGGVIKNNRASGVFMEGYSRGRISGLNISGNDIGVALGHEARVEVEKSTLTANGSGIGVWQSALLEAENNYFARNITGMIAVDSSTPVVKNNLFEENGGGITFADSAAGKVEGNSFNRHGPGIIVSGRSSPEIIANTFRANRYGIRNEGNSRASIIRNSLMGNEVAVLFRDHSRPRMEDNSFEENTNDTIDSRY